MNPDEQEAKSIRYTGGIRLFLLTSGNWAIFHSGEQGLSELQITNDLNNLSFGPETGLDLASLACRVQAAAEIQRELPRTSNISAEEIGL